MNSIKTLAVCLLVLAFLAALPCVSGAEERIASGPVLVGIAVSPFLPVVSLSLPVHFELSPRLYWGGSLNAFYVLGKSINGEVFIEPVYYDGSRLRLSSRLGFIVGWNEELSLGRTLDMFWGIGGHLVLLEGIFKMAPCFVSICVGIQVLTDFTHIAGSVYAGIGTGIMIHAD